ncbi:penicillin-binding protein 1C [Bacteroidota bacterium]
MILIKRNISFVLIVSIFGLLILYPLPDPLFNDPYSTVLESREGDLLGARIAGDGQWRFPVSDSLPVKYIACVISYEDRYYYLHPGVNPISLIRAAWQNIRAGEIISGGSTITMQLARMIRGNQKRTVYQKTLEMWLALRLELKYSKDEILGLYASHAPFGGNVVGINSAAWRYYNRSQFNLSWAEVANLTVLPNAPGLVFPGNKDDELRSKRNRLLKKVFDDGRITESDYLLAINEPIPLKPKPIPNHAQHLLDRVGREYGKGIQIRSTIDFNRQKTIMEIVEAYHNRFRHKEIHNAAAIVVEIETGDVIAYIGNVGNKMHGDHGQDVDIINSRRSPGSLLKPVLYALAIDEGLLTPTQLLPDIPMYYRGFAPQNFDKKFKGAVHANHALRSSLNVPFVHLLKVYGYEKMHHQLKRMGVSSLDKSAGHYGLTLILGGGEVSLWEISGLYAGMGRTLSRYIEANGEYRYNDDDYRPNKYISEGVNVHEKADDKHGIIRASAIWHAFTAMQELYRPDEFASWERFTSGDKIAWKTGTSYGHKDAWAIGLNSKYVVGVWLGNADGEGRPDLIGTTAAAPLMFRIFQVLDGKAEFPEPISDMVMMGICKESGHKAGENCPNREMMFVSKGVAIAQSCPYHQKIHLDEHMNWQVNSSCYLVKEMKHVDWFILPPTQAYYYKKYNSDYLDPPEFLDRCLPEQKDVIEMIYPRMFTKVYIPIEIDGNPGKVVFHAAHTDSNRNIYWHLDDDYIGTTTSSHQIGLRPKQGIHTLNLVDDYGNELLVRFEVLSD